MKKSKKKRNIISENKLKLAEQKLIGIEKEIVQEYYTNNKEKYFHFLNFLPVIVFECNKNGILKFINQHGRKKLKINFDKNEINIFKLINLTLNLDFLKYYSDEVNFPKNVINEFETEIVTDKESIYLVTRLEIFNDNNIELVRGISFDITKQKKSEYRLSELSKCLLSFTTSPEDNIFKLVQYIGKQIKADGVCYNKLDNNLLCCLAKWNLPDDYYPVDNPEGHICTDVITEGKNFLCIEDLDQTKYKKTDINVKQYNLKSYVAYSVKFEGQNIGCLSLMYKEKTVISEEAKWLLSVVSSAIATEESRRFNYDSIVKANIILNTTLELTRQIMSSDENIDLKQLFETIGTKLEAKKVFLLRFPNIESNFIEWIRPGFELEQVQVKYSFEEENYDISRLMEWVYTGEPFCISIDNYPPMFKPLVKTNKILNYYKILVPILINEKPWGIMGIGQILTSPVSDIARISFTNLCRLISLLIKQKEEKEKIDNIIDKKLLEFKQKANIE